MKLPNVGFDQIEAVKRLSKDGRDKLADEVNAINPAIIFDGVSSPNETVRKLICPLCDNGTGGDHTPVKAVWRDTFWHYKCYKCGELKENLLGIIAQLNNLTLSNFNDFCTALAVGASAANITVGNDNENSQRLSQRRYTRPKVEIPELPAQAPEYERLIEARLNVPKWFKGHSDVRGLNEKTLSRLMWGILFDFKHPNPDDRTKFLALIIPNDRGGIFSREIQTFSTSDRRGYYRNINPTAPTTIVKPTADKILLIVEGAIDGASIAQATDFQFGIIATGGTSGGKPLLARLHELFSDDAPKPKVILMFDNDDTDPDKNSGQKAAAKLLPEIRELGFVAVNRVISDETRRDANKILVDEGQDALKNRIESIIVDAQNEFSAVEKEITETASAQDELQNLLDEWQLSNGAIDPSVKPELLNAVEFVDNIKHDTLSADFVQSQKLFNALALCQFYGLSARATKVYAVIADKKNDAKEAAQLAKAGLTAPVDNDNRMWEQITVSDVKRAVNKLITEYKKAHDKWRKALEFAKRRDAEQAKIDARKLSESDALTKDQIDYLFSLENEDYDNAERLHYLFGNKIRYVMQDDQWLTFNEDKGLWIFGSGSKNAIVFPYAKRVAKLLSDNAPNQFDFPESKKVIDSWKSTKRVSLAVAYLKSNESIHITWDDLNRNRNFLNFRNGVVDLQTGKFYPTVDVRPDWLITRQCNMFYDPNAKSAVLDKFLRDIQPDDGTYLALLSLIGYMFTGEVSQQCVWMWQGNGSNGKSTLINLMLIAAADYATKLPTAAILESSRPSDANAATAALNPIIGKNMAFVNELRKNEFMNEPLIKDLTGGDKLMLRPLNKEARLVTPTAKLIINGNDFPRLRNPNDHSMCRRIRTIPFGQTFDGASVDTNLLDKLTTKEALSAFGNLIVDFAGQFYESGTLPESTRMRSTRSAYLTDNDFVAEFVEENCVLKESAFVPAKELYRTLRNTFPKETIDCRDKDLQRLILQNKSIRYARHSTTRQQCFFGIGLTDARAAQSDFREGEDLSPAERPPF